MRNIQIYSCFLLLTIAGCESSQEIAARNPRVVLWRKATKQLEEYTQEERAIKKQEVDLTAEYAAVLNIKEAIFLGINKIVSGEPNAIELRGQSFDESKILEYQLFWADLAPEFCDLSSHLNKFGQNAMQNAKKPSPSYNHWSAYKELIQKVKQYNPNATKEKCEVIFKPILHFDIWNALTEILEKENKVRSELLDNYERRQNLIIQVERLDSTVKRLDSIMLAEQEETRAFLRKCMKSSILFDN